MGLNSLPVCCPQNLSSFPWKFSLPVGIRSISEWITPAPDAFLFCQPVASAVSGLFWPNLNVSADVCRRRSVRGAWTTSLTSLLSTPTTSRCISHPRPEPSTLRKPFHPPNSIPVTSCLPRQHGTCPCSYLWVMHPFIHLALPRLPSVVDQFPALPVEQVDRDTMDMLRSINMGNLPGVQLQAVSLVSCCPSPLQGCPRLPKLPRTECMPFPHSYLLVCHPPILPCRVRHRGLCRGIHHGNLILSYSLGTDAVLVPCAPPSCCLVFGARPFCLVEPWFQGNPRHSDPFPPACLARLNCLPSLPALPAAGQQPGRLPGWQQGCLQGPQAAVSAGL